VQFCVGERTRLPCIPKVKQGNNDSSLPVFVCLYLNQTFLVSPFVKMRIPTADKGETGSGLGNAMSAIDVLPQ